MKVFVLDGNNRAALAITRALGKEGYEVIVGSENQPSLAGVSKFCSKKIVYTSPQKSVHQFVQSVLHTVKKHKPDILLPVSDITTMTITANRNHFNGLCSIPFPPYEAIQRAADKIEMLGLSKELGIGVPKSIVLHTASEVDIENLMNNSQEFPLVIKPQRSRVFVNSQWQSTRVRYASDEDDLVKELQAIPEEHYPVLLQERIIGPGVGIFLCLNLGEIVACFRHKRLREKPPSGGVSVLRESVPPVPSLIEESKRLLNELGWQGVAMVEFKQDIRDDKFKLMEINGRFWGSLQLAIDAGVNFPSILAKIALKEKVSPVLSYKIGVKSRWFLGDLDALLIRLFKSSSLNLPYNHPSKIQTLLDFMKLWENGLHYEVLKIQDMKPWFHELKHYLKGDSEFVQKKK